MNYDSVEVVIDKLVRTFKLRDWAYDIEDLVEDVAAGLKLIGASKVYEDKAVNITFNGLMARLPRDCENIKYFIDESTPYEEQGSFIVADMVDGTEGMLVYQAMPVDSRGFILVPDSEPVREALMWYMAKILVLGGIIKTINFQFADAEWDWRCGSARADLNALNLHQMNKVSNDFRRLNPLKDEHYKNYSEIGRGNTLDRDKDRSIYRN